MTEDITISCDGYLLQGTLHMPAADYPPIVIGCHGLMADRNSPKQIALAEECIRMGMAYLRFDHRGCGESQGLFEEVTTLDARCRDLRSALIWAGDDGRFANRVGLFGSSMGGTVCLASAADLNVAALVTVAAPIRSRALAAEEARPSDHIPAPGFFTTPERDFDIRLSLDEVNHTLMFHGDADEIVPLSQAQEIFACLQPPKQLVVQKNGDHRMSNPADQVEFTKLAADWFHQALL